MKVTRQAVKTVSVTGQTNKKPGDLSRFFVYSGVMTQQFQRIIKKIFNVYIGSQAATKETGKYGSDI